MVNFKTTPDPMSEPPLLKFFCLFIIWMFFYNFLID